MDSEDFDTPCGLGCALEMFSEKAEVFELLHSLPEVFQNTVSNEKSYETFLMILDRYQEQPHLLDPQMEDMINTCLGIFRSSSSEVLLPLKHLSLKYLKHIFKVRGRKEVVKRMPHEISELVPVLTFVESLNLDDATTWESAYVLVLWLSILVMNPFNLKLLDGASTGESVNKRLMALCYKVAVTKNSIAEASTALIMNFLTRPDMQVIYMGEFVRWTRTNLSPSTNDIGIRVGAFRSLTGLFKHAKREEILEYGKEVLHDLLNSSFEGADTVIRKLGTKLLQRIGQIFLKSRLAVWRYQRGNRSLLGNLQGCSGDASDNSKKPADDEMIAKEDPNAYEDLREYSGEIEKILDMLLTLLKDKDTVVRWSAAKGIGRVTNRLPQDYGDEVVESVLGSFSEREESGTWHGGCLALAELARRGLLLPARLPSTITVIQRALVYDEIKGNFAVGSHVRDAACYVFWAFARAFEPSVLTPYVTELAPSLVVTTLFDREVNCRRAASAAFQENVGRQGNFPHGIEIVALTDFYTIGVKTNSFTVVSVRVAEFAEYVQPMIDHLISLKFNHVDAQIRELTGIALGKLVEFDASYLRKMLIEKLIPVATAIHTPTSHGAITSICQIMRSLHTLGALELTPGMISDLRNVVIKILNKQFKELPTGHILLREAASTFIKTCAETRFPVHEDKEMLSIWHAVLEDHISSVSPSLRQRTAEAFPIFLQEYYYNDPFKRGEIKRMIDIFTQNLSSSVIHTRLGYILLLAHIPTHILRDSFKETLPKLCKCTRVTSTFDKDWADTRKEAVAALGSIFSNGILPGLENEADWREGVPLQALDMDLIFSSLTDAMSDYTTDKRGDIGSWVREAAMETIKTLLIALQGSGEEGRRILTPKILSNFLGLILKQCVEKIDNVRVHAAHVFTGILHSNPPIEAIPHRHNLLELFSKEFCETANWRAPAESFPRFLQLLPLTEFTHGILSGLVVCGGRIPGGGSVALTDYINNFPDNERHFELLRISSTILEIFKENSKVERVTVPLMLFLTQLLQSGIFLPLISEEPAEFGLELVKCVKTETLNSNRIEKVLGGVELLAELIQGAPSLVKAVLGRLVVYLCHSYPRVRTQTAAKLYEALLTYEETMDENTMDITAGMSLLSETVWTQPVDELRAIRNKFCACLNIPSPVVLPKKQGA